VAATIAALMVVAAVAGGPAALASGAAPVAAPDGAPVQTAKIVGSDAGTGDQSGYCVSISGTTAVVGAYLDDGAVGSDSGAAYVYVKEASGWVEQAKLYAPTPRAFGWFGWSVAISGDRIVVGSRYGGGASGNEGLVDVFVRSGSAWTLEGALAPTGSAPSDVFGYSVAISGDTVAVGAPWHDSYGQDAGAIYVFSRSGGVWSQDARLSAADAAAGDRLGHSVAVYGETVMAGAPWHDHGVTDGGAAYVFTRAAGEWSTSTELSHPVLGAGDNLGYSVALSDSAAVAGLPFADGSGTDSGAVDVFAKSGSSLTHQARLSPAGGLSGDWLGYSVAVSGPIVLAGAPWHDGPGMHSGLAYRFARAGSSWVGAAIEPSGLEASDWFGRSVAVFGDTALVGAFGDDDAGTDAGATYATTGLAPLTTQEDTTLTAAAPGVLANDTDPESDALTAELASGPANGIVSLGADGSFQYAPAMDFFGEDHFTYRAFDGESYSSAATVTVSVLPVNDPPVVTTEPRVYEADVPGGYAGALSGATVTDVDDATSTVVLTNDAPSPIPVGSTTITWTATDPHGGVGIAAQAVTVTERPKVPTTLTISRGAVSLVSYARSVAFSGTLTSGGSPVAGRRVTLERRVFGTSTWLWSGDATTGPSGAWTRTASVRQNTYWRARFAGDTSYLPTVSAEVWVKAKASAPAPATVPTAVYRNRTFTLAGYVYPAHVGKTRVYLYQYVGARWVARGYRLAINTVQASAGRSRYALPLRFTSRGRWMARAYHADTDHYPTWGTSRIITVR
jgi:hypothetical protein